MSGTTRLTSEQLKAVMNDLNNISGVVAKIAHGDNYTFVKAAKENNYNLEVMREIIHLALKLGDPEARKRVKKTETSLLNQYETLYCEVFNCDPTTTEVYEVMPEDPAATIEAVFSHKQYGITQREQAVIKALYLEDKTLDIVAAEHGVTRERIRQVEAKAIRKLKHPIRRRILAYGPDYIHAERATYAEEYERCMEQQRLNAKFDVKHDIEAANKPLTTAELNLSVRAYNVLARSGFLTVADLVERITSGKALVKLRNCGKKSCVEIVQKVRSYVDPDWLKDDELIKYLMEER